MVALERAMEEEVEDSMSVDNYGVSVVVADLPRHLQLLAETTELSEGVESAVRKVREVQLGGEDQSCPTELGLSLLELKNHLMLQYLTDLAYVQLLKTSGGKLSGDAAVDRLVTARTVLEKLRPLEAKVKHQVDKALKVAASGKLDEADPMHARANPAALLSKFGDSDDDEDEDNDNEEGGESADKESKSGKYVAPRHIPAFFDEDETAEAREEAAAKKEKKKMLSKSLLDDLRRQHLDTPEEVHEHEDVMKKRKVEAIKERVRYEEDNFMRLPLTKKQKHSRRQLSTMGTIADEVTAFGTSYFSENAGGNKGKKRKRASSAAKKKKKFRK